jgi:hypothetical protein
MRFRIDIPCDQEDIGQLKSALSRMNSPRPSSVNKKIDVPTGNDDSFVFSDRREEFQFNNEHGEPRETRRKSEEAGPEMPEMMESILQEENSSKKKPLVPRLKTGGFDFREVEAMEEDN